LMSFIKLIETNNVEKLSVPTFVHNMYKTSRG
jgi:hypothetical protein